MKKCFNLLKVCLCWIALSASSSAFAASRTVTITFADLAGTSAVLALDFLDGGPPGNVIQVSNFMSDGALGLSVLTGDVYGDLTSTVTIGDGSFFNEFLQSVSLGTYLRFTMSSTEFGPEALSFADTFAAYLLDATTQLSLFSSSDKTGGDALYSLEVGNSGTGNAYSGAGFYVSASPLSVAAVPEPETWALMLAGLALLFGFNRNTLPRRFAKRGSL